MTKRLFLLLVLLAIGTTCFADDHIVSVDPSSKVLSVEQDGMLKLYRVLDNTEITVNGAKAALPQLQPGQTVNIKAAGAINAVKIAASGMAGKSGSARPLTLRSVTVQIRVDGSDRVYYQDGKLWIEHMSAQKPTEIMINGAPWTPNWNGDKTDMFTQFNIPVAPIGSGHVSTKQFAGRSKIKQEHLATAPAVVTISDVPAGADDYEFQFSW
jgi:hypothetical protein